jgi:hypothetical protein
LGWETGIEPKWTAGEVVGIDAIKRMVLKSEFIGRDFSVFHEHWDSLGLGVDQFQDVSSVIFRIGEAGSIGSTKYQGGDEEVRVVERW